ncbi:MAG: tRNA (guanosine(46)-N7)-methyltransferase TrmB [Proteobacteria bacterium]|nr:tRNA (guanosine(46)-N7)-methyltransferase TrmB [Pseudomonadota bacterium]
MKFDSKNRQIRSFVLRSGKMTSGQKKALHDFWPKYTLEPKGEFDFENIFKNQNPTWLDIGFGNGESILHASKQYPEVNILGIEVHLPGIGHLLMEAERNKHDNIRIIRDDAVDVLNSHILDESLQAIHIYFPDPWHKKRHHKRRLVNVEFIQLIINKLSIEGRLHIATDWQEYALNIQQLLSNFPRLHNVIDYNGFSKKPDWRPETKFERRGKKLQHDSYDLILIKK